MDPFSVYIGAEIWLGRAWRTVARMFCIGLTPWRISLAAFPEACPEG
jgi:hypothetical protein